MALLLERNGYQFHLYSNDHPFPPHVHVRKAGKRGSWLLTSCEPLHAGRFTRGEQQMIRRIMRANLAWLWESHREYFGQQDAR